MTSVRVNGSIGCAWQHVAAGKQLLLCPDPHLGDFVFSLPIFHLPCRPFSDRPVHSCTPTPNGWGRWTPPNGEEGLLQQKTVVRALAEGAGGGYGPWGTAGSRGSGRPEGRRLFLGLNPLDSGRRGGSTWIPGFSSWVDLHRGW